ncbi:hypothetical protein ACVWXO_001035 [Bradyrhizobium sp. LM2.7]
MHKLLMVRRAFESTVWSRTLTLANSCKRGQYGSDGNIK